jgi:hypothetical protein
MVDVIKGWLCQSCHFAKDDRTGSFRAAFSISIAAILEQTCDSNKVSLL